MLEVTALGVTGLGLWRGTEAENNTRDPQETQPVLTVCSREMLRSRDKIEGSQPYLEGFRVSEVKHWAGKHPLRKAGIPAALWPEHAEAWDIFA